MTYQSNQMTRTVEISMAMNERSASKAGHDRRLTAFQGFREIKLQVAIIKVLNDSQRQEERRVLSSLRLGRRAWR
jgi:hypothetical protein